MVGKTISHYKIIEKLPISLGQVGEGGIGIVSLTDDFKLNRKEAKIYYFVFKTDHSEISSLAPATGGQADKFQRANDFLPATADLRPAFWSVKK